MKDLNKILLDDTLNPESKVYLISKELKKEGRLNEYLWYAILELKDKHFSEVQSNIKDYMEELDEPWYYKIGAPCEMLIQKPDSNGNGEFVWEKGKIIAGYGYKDGVITMELDDGKISSCFVAHTYKYRKPKEEKEKDYNEDPWYYTLGAECEMLRNNGEWAKGKIINGYKYRDGLITIELEDGSKLSCSEDLTYRYRMPI